MGGPANNAGLVFLNPRTNRHLQGGRRRKREREREREMPGHSARCTQLPRAAAGRAHLSLFLFFSSRGEERPAARRKRSHGPWCARSRPRTAPPILSNELSGPSRSWNAARSWFSSALTARRKKPRDRGPRYWPRPYFSAWSQDSPSAVFVRYVGTAPGSTTVIRSHWFHSATNFHVCRDTHTHTHTHAH